MKKKKAKQRKIGVHASNGKMYCLVEYFTGQKKEKKDHSFASTLGMLREKPLHNYSLSGYKIEETEDEKYACYVIRKGAQKDAYICPWCYFSKQKDFHSCIGREEDTRIIRLQYELQTKNGLSKAYLVGHECQKTNKFFLVEERNAVVIDASFCKENEDSSKRYTCPVCNTQLPSNHLYCERCNSFIWLVADDQQTDMSDFTWYPHGDQIHEIEICLDTMCTRGDIYNPNK